jgi:hypothetical protein
LPLAASARDAAWSARLAALTALSTCSCPDEQPINPIATAIPVSTTSFEVRVSNLCILYLLIKTSPQHSSTINYKENLQMFCHKEV